MSFFYFSSCWESEKHLKILHYVQDDAFCVSFCPPLLKGGGSQSRRIFTIKIRYLPVLRTFPTPLSLLWHFPLKGATEGGFFFVERFPVMLSEAKHLKILHCVQDDVFGEDFMKKCKIPLSYGHLPLQRENNEEISHPNRTK